MKKWVWIVIGASIVLVGLTIAVSLLSMKSVGRIMASSNQPQEITVGEDTVSISCMYGCKIPISEIVSVERLDELPPIKLRTNGSSTREFAKGHFLLENGERCMLFVRWEAPYIEMRTTDNLYYLNSANKEETENLYEQLKTLKP